MIFEAFADALGYHRYLKPSLTLRVIIASGGKH
jgi:hypothetical protein